MWFVLYVDGQYLFLGVDVFQVEMLGQILSRILLWLLGFVFVFGWVVTSSKYFD